MDTLDLSTRQRLRGSTCPVHPDHPIALVGEAPGPRTRSDCPFYPYPASSAAGRLLDCLGWTRGEYMLTFARVNLLHDWPGPSFPVAEARACIPDIVRALAPRPMLLMGRGVAAAFGLRPDHPLLQLTSMKVAGIDATVAIVPHPSGRNLWYNDAVNRAKVRTFISALRGDRLTPVPPPVPVLCHAS
jgi:hypothetical protein